MKVKDFRDFYLKDVSKSKSFVLLLLLMTVFPVLSSINGIYLGKGIDMMTLESKRAIFYFALFLTLRLMMHSANYAGTICQAKVKVDMSKEMRDRLYQAVLFSDWSWWNKQDKGEYKELLTDQISEVTEDITTLLAKFLEVVFGGTSAVIAAFWVDPSLAILVCLYFPIAVYVSIRIGRGCLATHEAQQAAIRNEIGIINDVLRGIREIILFQKSSFFLERCKEAIINTYRCISSHMNKVMQYQFAEEISKLVGYLGILIIGLTSVSFAVSITDSQ